MQKLLLSASLLGAGLLFGGTSAIALPAPAVAQSGQQAQQETKSVAGTVASIGDQGHSFTLDVNDGGKKQALQFVLDKNAQIKGHVTVGSSVKVDYVAMADQNIAKVVTAQA